MPRIEARRICLIRLSAIGDIVHGLALANGLRRGYADAHLTWILEPIGYEMMREQRVIDEFIVFHRKKGVDGWRDLHRILRQRSFDLLLTPQISFKSSLVSFFVRSTIKMGFDFARSRELHWFFTNRHLPAHAPQHVLDQFREFLTALDIPIAPPEWNIRFTDDELAGKATFFERFRAPVVGFIPASSNPDKDWTPEGYSRAIEHVTDRYGMEPLIIGGPGKREKEFADEVCRLSRRPPAVALERPIRKTMWQLSGCRLVIGPDTGPLHIAVALGIPVIGLFGYSNPRRCGPYYSRELIVDRYTDPGEETGPIRRRVRPGRMARITPEEVIARIDQALGV